MENNAKFFNRNFFIRCASAILLAPIFILIIYNGGIAFDATVIVMAVLMAFEWKEMLDSKPNSWTWKLIAIFYITLPCTSLIWIMHHQGGNKITLWLIITVWLTDIAAYICGRTIGGPKLAPKISPNKTWSGLIGGVIATTLFGTYALSFIDTNYPYAFITLSGLLALYAQAGDLFESWIKRFFNIKDSGNLIPGHGGILDRVDGIVLSSTKIAFILLVENHWQLFNI